MTNDEVKNIAQMIKLEQANKSISPDSDLEEDLYKTFCNNDFEVQKVMPFREDN